MLKFGQVSEIRCLLFRLRIRFDTIQVASGAGGSLPQVGRDGIQLNRFDDFPMTLLVPVLVLALLVLGWIAWLAFGPRSTPILHSCLLGNHSLDASDRELLASGLGSVPDGTNAEETEHLRNRLHASNSSASPLTGNALHLELRPALHRYGTASGQYKD